MSVRQQGKKMGKKKSNRFTLYPLPCNSTRLGFKLFEMSVAIASLDFARLRRDS
jgi:hypothetical protein